MTLDVWTQTSLRAALPLRAGAFIVTLFGDAIVPRGGEVWVGNIIETCAGVGISETLVRTAVSRLVTAGVLTGTRDGRRSFYRLTDRLLPEFDSVGARLFDPPAPPKGWQFVADDGEGPKGFARLAPQVFLGPEQDAPEGAGVIFRAEAVAGPAVRALAVRLWGLDDLAQGWRGFCDAIAPLAALSPPPPEKALIARLAVIHAYRRQVLATPVLPAEAFGEDWPGHMGRKVFARAYLALSPAAEGFLADRFFCAQGALARDSAVSQSRLEAMRRAAGA